MMSSRFISRAVSSRLLSGSVATEPGSSRFKLPWPTSVRKDSLLVACMVAAVIYYVPQDIGILGMYLVGKSACGKGVDSRVKLENPEESLDKYLQSRSIDKSAIKIDGKNSNKWKVRFANQFD